MLLEVRAVLRRATKQDLFTGDVNNLKSPQGVKENTTVFYRDQNTKEIQGPYRLTANTDFVPLFTAYAFGCVGVIKPIATNKTNDYVFDLVLRTATIADVAYLPLWPHLNRIYYIYSQQQLSGPFYIDGSTTINFLENLINKNQLFVPNERQHFKKKEHKKPA